MRHRYTAPVSFAARRSVRLLITDLDNTLFDWLGVWAASFSAMLQRLSRDSGIPISNLEAEFQAIHQKHGTVEYAFSINELPSLLKLHPGENLAERYEAAIMEFRTARRAQLQLYPGVFETLSGIRQTGCAIIGYTESFAFYSAYRIRKLDLDLLLDVVYSPADHDLPPHITLAQLRRYADERYQLRRTVHRHTPSGARKPNPNVLRKIVKDARVSLDNAIYVGDSLMKDVLMAQQAGVADAWAKYGFAPRRPEYELLKRVTHWSPADVAREKALSSHEVTPTHVLEDSFSELLRLFDFGGSDMPATTVTTRTS